MLSSWRLCLFLWCVTGLLCWFTAGAFFLRSPLVCSLVCPGIGFVVCSNFVVDIGSQCSHNLWRLDTASYQFAIGSLYWLSTGISCVVGAILGGWSNAVPRGPLDLAFIHVLFVLASLCNVCLSAWFSLFNISDISLTELCVV